MLQLLGAEAAAVEQSFRSSKSEQGDTSRALSREKHDRQEEKRRMLKSIAEVKAELAASKKELATSQQVGRAPRAAPSDRNATHSPFGLD